MKLSILVCTLPEPERQLHLERLKGLLSPQIEGLHNQVEIQIHPADRSMPTGTKRNELIDMAQGDYFCFVDDDDIVSPSYVEEILKATENNPDVITFNGWMTTNGRDPIDFVIKLGERYEARDGKYYRWPNHLCVFRKQLVGHIKFMPIYMGEDFDWSVQVRNSGLLKTTVHIEKPLYHYDFITNKPANV